MDDKLNFLYNQIRKHEISPTEAVEQIKRFKAEPVSTGEIYSYDEPYLRDHTVLGERVLIGVTHASLAINAFFKKFPHETSVHLNRLSFVKPVELKKGQRAEVVIRPVETGTGLDFQMMYRYDSSSVWNLTASGKMQAASFEIGDRNLARINASLEEYADINRIYTGNPAIGLGDSFRTITHVYTGKDLVLARVTLHQGSGEERHQYILHPLILNSAFLAIGPLVGLNGKQQLSGQESYLPFGIKDIYFRKTGVLGKCWLMVTLTKNSGEMIVFDADVVNDNSEVIAHLRGCSLKRLRSSGHGFAGDKPFAGSRKADRLSSTEGLGSTDLPAKIQEYLNDKLNRIIPDPSRPAKPEVNIMDLGAESAQLVALTSEIEKETGIELYPTLFFEYPNVKELTEYFVTEHSDSFDRLLGKSLNTESDTGDIAVIGIHGMFPESADLDEFWNNLCTKKDFIREIPPGHWDYRPWYDPDPEAKNKTYCKWGSFIDDVDKFDAGFFNISRREAEWMDPQLRLLLQSIYAAGEDAGYISRLRGTNTGVFVGVCFHDYADKIAELNLPVNPHIGTGNTQTVIANRVSFFFDFTGPSVAVDTACSSSLFALHQACQALHSRECDMAFVGGVNLLLSSWHYRYFSSIGALSPTGHCHTFDEAADGYVPGECIASILLKPLSEAERDRDHIYAVIKGSAALHGGYTPSLTAPSIAGESNVILKAWEKAGIDPETVTYIEAHGTGTKLGDPIEINSLQKAFQKFTGKEHFCPVGSVKASIGHAEGAAGIAGVLKVILQMKHRKIPPMPLFNRVNPYIKLEKSPLYINREVAEWKSSSGVPRRAGVSSFGFSGAYAHVVIEEYIAEDRSQVMATPQKPAVIVLSAKNEDRLKDQARNLLDFIRKRQFLDTGLADMAYTLQVGREVMEERLAMIAGSVDELREKLEMYVAKQGMTENPGTTENIYQGRVKRERGNLAAVAAVGISRDSFPNTCQGPEELCQLWVQGYDIDWNLLYKDIKPCLISMPTYPFARERYWIPDQSFVSESPGQSGIAVEQVITDTSATPFANVSGTPIANVPGKSIASIPCKPAGISLEPLTAGQPFPHQPFKPEISVSPRAEVMPEKEIPSGETQFSVSVEAIQQELAAKLADVLYMQISDIDVDATFVEMGMDSVIGVEWIQAVNKKWGTAIQATRVYDYPTIREFAGFMVRELKPPAREAASKTVPQIKLRESTAHHEVVELREIEPGIVQVVMQDRAGKNAFSDELIGSLNHVFNQIEANPEYKVVILTGYDSYFSSGGTKEGLLAIHEGRIKYTDTNVYRIGLDCKIPVIAAMQGHAFGAGWCMGMFCDFVIMSRESIYTANFMKYGFTPGAGATLIFPEKMGIDLAQEILFSGKKYYGAELEGKGVGCPVIPRKEVLSYALQLAETLAESSRDSLIILKDQMSGSLRKRLTGTIEKELDMQAKTFVHVPEVKEKIQSTYGRLITTDKGSGVPETDRLPPDQQPPDQQPPDKRSADKQPHKRIHSPENVIAIIGAAGQFPKSKNLASFWDNLAHGRDCVSEIPARRWNAAQFYDPDPGTPGKTNCKWMGALDDADRFDAMFFNITPAEAELMDPQQRLFLENSWHCIEDAGLNPGSLSESRCGVFVGCATGDYWRYMKGQDLNARVLMGGTISILAARISYFLNLKGPCMAIDTACSSSLVAVAEACNSLILEDCDLALAGGAYVMAGPSMHIMAGKAGMLSPDGRCFAFDTRANGFVPGEGVGVILLKRLSDAVRDRDQVYGVIRGWGVNQDGKTNGITAPSTNSQIMLEKDVYRRFGINPETITLVEAHGTGTKLGDPIEVEALATAFGAYTAKRNYCALGSVKNNIGHLLTAAGIAGVIKILLALKHKKLPPVINCEKVNELISLENSPFYINTQLQRWEALPGQPRRAAVSSFGYSGTNAHIVIEEYPEARDIAVTPSSITPDNPILFVLSAKSPEQLKSYAESVKGFIETNENISLPDMAYTLQVGREGMDYRLAFAAESKERLTKALNGFIEDSPPQGVLTGHGKKTGGEVLLFEADDDAKTLLQSWIKNRKLHKLAELWVKGLNINWDDMYGEVKPRRVSLPVYPFAGEHYWATEWAIEDITGQELGENLGGSGGGKIAEVSDRVVDLGTAVPAADCIEHLKTLMAEVTKIPMHKLDPETHFEEMGLDSITITALNKKIEQWVGKTDATLFFKYNSIRSLGAYLVEAYPEAVSALRKETATEVSAAPVQTGRRPGVMDDFHKDKQTFSDEDKQANTDIAIIGVAGRYPQAETLEQFWQNLYEGRDCIEEIPASRWPLEGFYEPDRAGAAARGLSYSKWGGFLSNVDCFDPLFFNISPKDAVFMDPQERLFLETAWACLEDAGYTRESLQMGGYGNRIGVFAGATFNNYQLFMAEAARQANGKFYAANSQTFSIANRVSYVMNFTGPSLTVDTACSSSLYALHLACESIRSGQSRMAVAGGVNLSLHPSKYITLSEGQFSASDGRCRAFTAGGTGYVPSEGVGAVFLKPLPDALRDNDRIYGIIKGTAAGHAGKTNGYTVPSPVSQSLVIEEALRRSRIDPRTVSCIEAHGTGTALGDPIEMNGLTDVFRKYTGETGFCSISSVKSNIGHTEAAAGMAQLTKVLLQFKHQTLVKNVMHGEGLNPNIDFAGSPFFIQEITEPWKRPVIDGREYPRRAGISSFGAGGANAHIVVEENIIKGRERRSPVIDRSRPAVIVLSAKNEGRLREQSRRLLTAIRERQHTDSELADIAYTLQVGREAMEERLALTVGSVRELEDKLQDFITGREDIPDLYRGNVKRDKATLEALPENEEKQGLVDKWIQGGSYGKISDLWVRGLVIDWNRLYGDMKPSRISLPVYPFARERYWVAEAVVKDTGKALHAPGAAQAAAGTAAGTVLHPLLHQNTSDFSEQRFSTTFTGHEFFLADHVVKGRRVLPGVGYLEMARTAAALAAGVPPVPSGLEQPGIRLKNVVWTRPVVVGEHPVRVHIALFPGDSGEIAYEIYSHPGETGSEAAGTEPAGIESEGTEPVVHSQGSTILGPLSEMPPLDLTALQTQCSLSLISPARCYEAFSKMGIDYGPAHRGIEEIYVGLGQVLAKLALPAAVSGTEDSFVLHPSLTDAALQAAIVLMMDAGDGEQSSTLQGRPVLPFALEELEVCGRSAPVMWALIRYSEGSRAGDKVPKIDIDICDDRGNICIRMKRFSSRVLDSEGSLPTAETVETAETTGSTGTLMLIPCWDEGPEVPETPGMPDYERHLVILCGPGDTAGVKGKAARAVAGVTGEDAETGIETAIESHMEGVRCLTLRSGSRDIGERFQDYALQVFEEIQGILKEKPAGRVLIQVVVSGQGEEQLFCGLTGMLKTARLENPKLVGQLIETVPDEDLAGIISKLKENSQSPADSHIKYHSGRRWVAGWRETEQQDKDPEEAGSQSAGIPWKDRGVYLITGGAGGLGLIFAEEIVQLVKDTALILTGRSPLSEVRQARLKELEVFGARVSYRQVDVSDRNAVAGLIADIREEYGRLDGIIHGAGLLRDSFIVKKTTEEVCEVLSPKVTGLVNLDRATKDMALDFFILFSSIAGSLGNPGQADYAAANAFMDAYAGYRNRLAAEKQRHGQTLSVNWPLWQDGGMRIDEETEKMVFRSIGVTPMRSTTGIRFLYRGLASGADRVFVVEGSMTHMRQKLLTLLAATASPVATIDTDRADSLQDRVRAVLVQNVSKLLQVKMEDIDNDTELSEYGFDSVTLTRFTNEVNEEFGLELTPTIFFEYPTLNGFSEYLATEHYSLFKAKYGAQTAAEAGSHATAETTARGPEIHESQGPEIFPPGPTKNSGKKQRPRFASIAPLAASEAAPFTPEPVAIIGMSGLFPMAEDVNEFWQNLVAGRDCITEIPKERWNWREFYGDPSKEAYRTNIKWGGFIEGVDRFDPMFFAISPREAELMDPQQRLLMTYIWKAIEDAGYSAQSLSGSKTGIFVGTTGSGYNKLMYRGNLSLEGYSATGTVPSVGPNRMSYFLNIHGPSEPIETACSSSLVAIHRAVSAIADRSCDMALVGGVNTILTPELHISFSKAGMLCEDGRCKTFSDKANGYVRGEGVGIIFLKRLQDAEEAGDHIYGIIRGSAENHGGRGASLTAPNPKAQADLLVDAYTRAGIDPDTVTYIEAHGTGTRLGDPVEINGLKNAFKELYRARGVHYPGALRCALGSVKTNIGHLELAAGIAGVIKVLLQFKHKTLVKSLHCDPVNPYISLDGTPFYISRETREWEALRDAAGREVPRRAGVSSFGFGGVNAHVVLEEYVPKRTMLNQVSVSPQNPAAIVLSAKNNERLRERVQQLLAAIRGQQFADSDLIDMAYTLQVGREAMEERLALTVSSVRDLEGMLQDFITGREDIPNLYRGNLKHNKETFAALAADEEMQETVEKWFRRGKYAKILDLWVRGLVFDWNRLYGDVKPRRISLPVYPFARERYWVPESGIKPSAGASILSDCVPGATGNAAGIPAVTASLTGALIHPLLHQNTSDFTEQRFSSTFTGHEFFLADHVVNGRRVLPGVAYLEMACTAAALAAGVPPVPSGQERPGIRLKNVVWTRPVAVGEQPVRVHTALFPEDNGEIAYEIYSEPGETGLEPAVHSQGSVVLGVVSEVPFLDLTKLRAQCSQYLTSPDRFYEAFGKMGIDYGPAHRGIEEIYVGSGQVLAKLALPVEVSDTKDSFVLHPSLADAALQASIALMTDAGDKEQSRTMLQGRPLLPFALEELEVSGRSAPVMWALLRYSEGSRPGHKVPKIDIDICDDKGNVCIRMKRFSSRVLEDGTDSAPGTGTLMLIPCWNEKPEVPEKSMAPETAGVEYEQHLVILCEPGDTAGANREAAWGVTGIAGEVAENGIAATVESSMEGVRCLTLHSGNRDIGERFQCYAVQVFEEIRNILKDKPGGRVLIQVVVSGQGEQQLFSGLTGMLITARLENPKLVGQLIETMPDEDLANIISKLKENSLNPADSHIRYNDGRRWVAGWRETDKKDSGPNDTISQAEPGIPWRDRGVYLITGGAGGLGLIFAGEIMHRVRDSVLILTGRSPLSEDRQVRVRELEASGARVSYRQVDVSDRSAVAGLIADIREEYGGLNGIIHGAGLLRDGFIVKKTSHEVREVLSPKVTGLVNLDEACKDMELDFFILFSSIAGSMGNPGQADYAAANAFMDAYAGYRNRLAAQKQRHGQTLSISWPLWQDGGMRVDEETEKMVKLSIGMIPMQTSTGIRFLYRGLASGADRVFVMEGSPARMRQKLGPVMIHGNEEQDISSARTYTVTTETGVVQDKVRAVLLQNAARLLKVRMENIDGDTDLTEYGFDSITLTRFTKELNEEYGLDLNPTVFFEYSTLNSFSKYLVTGHHSVFMARYGGQTSVKAGFHAPAPYRKISGKRRPRFASTVPPSAAETEPSNPKPPNPVPVAIVGMSGIFPMAEDVNKFWQNLVAGRDCITEIPKDRWDWREFYGDPLKEPNKTNIKWGGFIDGIDRFDPLFFGISPKEAKFMDPQQRLLMTYIWKAIEDAGYSPKSLSGSKTGIFVGTAGSGYQSLISQANLPIEGYFATGTVASVGPNRMSYFLDIHGPSEPIETACSSSLVAIHRAVNAIENRHCEMAVAGGVNTIVTPDFHIGFSKAGMLCADGRCKTFSDKANGYVRGEGVGMIVLKRLQDAEDAGDHIYGIIRGTAENHGGRTNSLTAPNPRAQAKVLIEAYTRAGIEPGTITYIETHGTGTELGDPIEINGLKAAFKELSPTGGGSGVTEPYCGLGSVKSNIGHLELAAGIAGVIKVLLQFQHKTLVKSLHCDTVNPYISLDDSPFYIVRETGEWKALKDSQGRAVPRRAGVSSFGFGGVNAHVVLEEYIPRKRNGCQITVTAENPAIILLSAKNKERLRERTQQLLTAVREVRVSDEVLADVAYTLQVGREAMEERLATTVGSVGELEEILTGYVEGKHKTIEGLYQGKVKGKSENSAIFSGDEDMDKTIDAWISKKKYGKLLELWAAGLTVDWNSLYQDVRPCRISLPTYPFARERYWITEIRKTADVSSSSPKYSDKRDITPLIKKPERIVLSSPAQSKGNWNQPTTQVSDQVSDQISDQISDHPQGATGMPWNDISVPQHEPELTRSYTTPETLEEELKVSLAEALDMNTNEIDTDEKFANLGLDSVTGVEWIQALKKKFGISITATRVYDYPTIREFAQFLSEQADKQKDCMIQMPVENTGELSVDDLLRQVQLGILDIEQANGLLKQYDF